MRLNPEVAWNRLGSAWGCLGLLGVDVNFCHGVVIVSNNATLSNPEQPQAKPEQFQATSGFNLTVLRYRLPGVIRAQL